MISSPVSPLALALSPILPPLYHPQGGIILSSTFDSARSCLASHLSLDSLVLPLATSSAGPAGSQTTVAAPSLRSGLLGRVLIRDAWTSISSDKSRDEPRTTLWRGSRARQRQRRRRRRCCSLDALVLSRTSSSSPSFVSSSSAQAAATPLAHELDRPCRPPLAFELVQAATVPLLMGRRSSIIRPLEGIRSGLACA